MLLEIGQWNQVTMPQAHLKVKVSRAEGQDYDVKISADSFVQDVMLFVQDTDVFYSDNAFCMDSGREKTVRVHFSGESGRGKRLLVKAWNAEDFVVLLE